MELKPITVVISAYPSELHSLLRGAIVFDSSCSPQARVIYIDKDGGYFLKSAPKGSLEREAEMARYFHSLGLSAQVLAYISEEWDWLLTERVPGDDCVTAKYLEQPERLCDVLAEQLAQLHQTSSVGCPVHNHTQGYLRTAAQNYAQGAYDKDSFPDNWGYASPEEAWREVESGGHLLQNDTFIHGDYCLPNIILDDWKFSGYIDLGNGGVGDRNVDIFWATWSLAFNLRTDKFRQRFLDAYGRNNVDEDRLRVVAAVEVFG